jgi:hypothetical protein
VITEMVTLAPSQSVGATKRGNRNIIPITGGEISGRITGKVLFGGADYQSRPDAPAIDVPLANERRRHHHRSKHGFRQSCSNV